MSNNFEGKVAIVGMACRLPGARNIREYWSNLVNELETLTVFTDEQLIESGVDPEVFKMPNYVRRRGVVNGAEYFDPEFFGFTPREAELMDPQHRIFLECAWHALEDSGYDPATGELKVGVFGGTGSPYHLIETIDNPFVNKNASGTSIITSNDKDYVTTRVSYKLNLNGPSVNVQSACSTSLVAVSLGMDSLLSYQCDVILAGGATVELPEYKGYLYQEAGLESPDGRCRTFDKDAQGTIFSRGCGVVALKRLEDAVADGDHIYAVLLGSAINNDGNKKVGYTAPSVEGQVEVVNQALDIAEISPETITYVEAHGTATPVGDPIEVNSLTKAFSSHTDRKQYCAIGSVKTNIGHTDVASGLASIIKVALSLEHKIIPASLHFNEPNPKIDFESSPFFVNTKTTPWNVPEGTPRRALVNSFGVGGTNACIIMEEPPRFNDGNKKFPQDVMLLSARNEKAFESMREELIDFLEKNPETDLHNMAHTSRVGRRVFDQKGYVTFADRQSLMDNLRKAKPTRIKDQEDRRMIFMFPGQGNQYINMGRDLYEQSPVFRAAIDECARLLQPELKLDIRTIIYPAADELEHAKQLINETYITQPAIFTVSYATAQVWLDAGLQPEALIGHSVGEYVAACIAGVFSLSDALLAIARRGKLVHELPGGSMLAVLVPEKDLQPMLPEGLEISVVNSPELCVVSGPSDIIESFSKELSAKRIFNKTIPTSHAFHSHMMDPCLEPFAAFFTKIKLNAPKIPIVSSVTGQWLTDEEAKDTNYWVQHVRKAVRFADAAAFALNDAPTVFLECGPGQSLESAVKRQLPKDHPHAVTSSIPPAEDPQGAGQSILKAAADLWMAGKVIDWEQWFPGCRKISYPGYPFQRKPYKIDFSKKLSSGKKANRKKDAVKDWMYVPSWRRTSSVDMLQTEYVGADSENEVWLVFVKDRLTESIASNLVLKGAEVYTIRMGAQLSISGNEVVINPDVRADYIQMLDKLQLSGKSVRIIHGWNIGGNPDEDLSFEKANTYTNDVFYRLFYLEQAMIEKILTQQVSLMVLTDGLCDVLGEGVTYPQKALAIGPVRSLYKEHLNMTTRIIDVQVPESESALKVLSHNIIHESRVATEENIVAYRNRHRWTEAYEQVFMEPSYTRALKNGGVYLITGGSGGIGQVLSKLIAETVEKPVIVMVNRSAMPDRAQWQAIVDDPEQSGSNVAEKIRTIQYLESKGVTVHLGQADVTDIVSMKKLVADVEQRFGTVNGVFHSAGTAGGGVIALQNKELTDVVLLPKVNGTLVLHEIFRHKKLDMFYLFSSITAILGEAGRADYCSGNSFLDAYANYRSRRESGTVMSVNWGQWGIIGMAADFHRNKNTKKEGKRFKLSDGISRGVQVSEYDIQADMPTWLVAVDQQDWMMSSHLITGYPTLVGTTYIEALLNWAKMNGKDGSVVLNNMGYVSPYMLNSDQQRELVLFIEETAYNVFRFKFRSRPKAQDGKRSFWQDHLNGEIAIEATTPAPVIDVAALKAKHNKGVDESQHFLEVTGDGKVPVIAYGNRWDCKKRMLLGDKQWLIELSLRDEYLSDFDEMSIHPAMIDVATSAQFMQVTDTAFLPFGYRQCKLYGKFGKDLISHARLAKEFHPEDDHVFFDFDIFTTDGTLVMSIEGYDFMKVAQSKSESSSQQAAPAKSQPQQQLPADPADILPEEGLEAFKLLLGADGITQTVVYTLDLKQDFVESQIFFKRNERNKKDQADAEPAYERPELDTPFEEPDNEIEKSIATIWRGILGIDKIGVNDTFNELGGNSLLAIQTISNIAEEFNIDLQAHEFFENATIRGLAGIIVNKILVMHSEVDLENILSEL